MKSNCLDAVGCRGSESSVEVWTAAAFELNGPTERPLVVCVPGVGVDRADFRFLSPALADFGNRVAVMDIRGHGHSFADNQHPLARPNRPGDEESWCEMRTRGAPVVDRPS